MGILINTGFDLGSSSPIDNRTLKNTIDERDALISEGKVYENLKVYCKDTQTEYRWNGAAWEEVGTGSSGGGTTDISMTDYYTKTEVNNDFLKKTDATSIYATKTELDEKVNFDAINNNYVGKETVLYEGCISTIGTHTLADNVNAYDFIIINYTETEEGMFVQSLAMSKSEISKCISNTTKFMCNYGYSNSTSYVAGYFDNDKLIIANFHGQYIRSITGYKFGQITVANTITNPSPAVSYSTDEQLTGGTWIDGKPIYRKVLICTARTALGYPGGPAGLNTWKVVPGWSVVIPNINEYVNVNIPKSSSSRIDYNIPSTDKSLQFFCIAVGTIGIEVGDKLIIEYTKTTD